MVLGTRTSPSKKKGQHKRPTTSGIVLAARQATLAQRSGFGYGVSSSSQSVGHNFISTNSFGRRTTRQELLLDSALRVRQKSDQKDYQHHNNSITIAERTQLASIRADENENNFYDQDDPSNVDIHDILTGEVTADLSHAGGEFAELLAIEDGLFGPVSR